MTLAEREELRRVGRENDATAGVVCPAHVRAAFNFEFDDIDIDVPLEELLVEASKETPRWRVMLTPLPGAEGEPDSQSMPGQGTGLSSSSTPAVATGETPACSGEASRDGPLPPITAGAVFMLIGLAMATSNGRRLSGSSGHGLCSCRSWLPLRCHAMYQFRQSSQS